MPPSLLLQAWLHNFNTHNSRLQNCEVVNHFTAWIFLAALQSVCAAQALLGEEQKTNSTDCGFKHCMPEALSNENQRDVNAPRLGDKL